MSNAIFLFCAGTAVGVFLGNGTNQRAKKMSWFFIAFFAVSIAGCHPATLGTINQTLVPQPVVAPVPTPAPAAATPTPTPTPLQSGLLCNLYNLAATQPTSLPNFNPEPSQTIVGSQTNAGPSVATWIMSSQIDFLTQQAMLSGSGQSLTTWYAIDCQGVFEATGTQDYLFTLNSDDGSALLIDGFTVIDNDGEHSAKAISGSIALEAGQHTIELQYFQGPGVAVLQLFSNITMEFFH